MPLVAYHLCQLALHREVNYVIRSSSTYREKNIVPERRIEDVRTNPHIFNHDLLKKLEIHKIKPVFIQLMT